MGSIRPFRNEFIQVIVETPKCSPYKYDFHPALEIFQLNKILPLGMEARILNCIYSK